MLKQLCVRLNAADRTFYRFVVQVKQRQRQIHNLWDHLNRLKQQKERSLEGASRYEHIHAAAKFVSFIVLFLLMGTLSYQVSFFRHSYISFAARHLTLLVDAVYDKPSIITIAILLHAVSVGPAAVLSLYSCILVFGKITNRRQPHYR